ncbi:hypothetical protein HWC53_gp100 [Bacillus phage vB_BmeM-Goe8]|uniref:Uncharacterized protein n=1 Tax=Bacillus phage vB_BmeM-Goe8 TaxID=2593638 RepID=A0A516KN15_9CAUD|nr:hypothetical protein HWC53_gp100 [Bacillus phage vB_BmeM-Goe8]QDP42989.1 hypothetical protein Goe8_c02160 [Bacillus phage vB_BmeM-Goe8]
MNPEHGKSKIEQLIEEQAEAARQERLQEIKDEPAVPTPLSDLMKLSTDKLLDVYNDYMSMHKKFGDDNYKDYAQMVIGILKVKTRNKASQ